MRKLQVTRFGFPNLTAPFLLLEGKEKEKRLGERKRANQQALWMLRKPSALCTFSCQWVSWFLQRKLAHSLSKARILNLQNCVRVCVDVRMCCSLLLACCHSFHTLNYDA